MEPTSWRFVTLLLCVFLDLTLIFIFNERFHSELCMSDSIALHAACWLRTMKSDQQEVGAGGGGGMGNLFTTTVSRKMNRTVMNRE
jgi:hypothetical protein